WRIGGINRPIIELTGKVGDIRGNHRRLYIVHHVDGVFLVVQRGNALSGQLARCIYTAIVHEQIAGTRRYDTQHLIVTVLHEGRSLGLRQGGQQRFQVVITWQCTDGTDASGETVERANTDVRRSDGITLAGVEISNGHAFIGVGLELEIHPMGFHFQSVVLDHVVYVAVGADNIEHTHGNRLGRGQRGGDGK